ncbi:MAG: PHP domain-containing protein [Candidatus Heimdallarchaeota archaeon]
MVLSSISRMNLHNHSIFSDGSYEVATIIKTAEQDCSLDIVGICDHYRTQKVWEHSLDPQRILPYLEHIRQIDRISKSPIRVLIGMEIDFSPRTADIDSLPTQILNKLDFILFEYVNSQHWGGFSHKKLLDIREHFDIPVGIAHCDFRRDLWMGETDTKVLYEIAEADIFLELSPGSRNRELTPSGPQPYYRQIIDLFIEIREKDIPLRFSIGTDMHSDLSEVCATTDAEKFLEEYQLLNHLISL